ncbi:MAG: FAD-linked oxidase C-terminal domain-containing protein, partial [Steroidobacteraceae bacterium]
RVSLPAHTPALPLAGPVLMEWGGSLRWLPGPQERNALRSLAARLGGHATLYRTPVRPPEGPFQPLSGAMLAVHKRLKAAFDPSGILNPGRLHPDL